MMRVIILSSHRILLFHLSSPYIQGRKNFIVQILTRVHLEVNLELLPVLFHFYLDISLISLTLLVHQGTLLERVLLIVASIFLHLSKRAPRQSITCFKRLHLLFCFIEAIVMYSLGNL